MGTIERCTVCHLPFSWPERGTAGTRGFRCAACDVLDLRPDPSRPPRYLVVRKRDTEPSEVYPFWDREPAETFYQEAKIQWTGCYLCQVLEPLR